MGTTFLGPAREEGKLLGMRSILRTLLEARFGPLNPLVHQRLETLSAEQLQDLAVAMCRAESLQELGLMD